VFANVSVGRTWLDRELVADKRTPLAEVGFDREVMDALYRAPNGWWRWVRHG
jgi:hypothetical protein